MVCDCECVAGWVAVGVGVGDGVDPADPVDVCVSDAVDVCVGVGVGEAVEEGGPAMRTMLLVKSVIIARAPAPSNATSRGLLNVAAVLCPSV